jgi:hypothetical protein
VHWIYLDQYWDQSLAFNKVVIFFLFIFLKRREDLSSRTTVGFFIKFQKVPC